MDTSQTIIIQVNGQSESISSGQTLGQFILCHFREFPNIVAELNGEIILRDCWDTTSLKAQDCLELINFVGGG